LQGLSIYADSTEDDEDDIEDETGDGSENEAGYEDKDENEKADDDTAGNQEYF
jgi:hypothetical protein